MSAKGGPDIVRNGLVLYLDAANIKSYPGSGTVWEDMSGNNNNGTLTNGPTFNSGSLGSIVFDGVNDYIIGTIPSTTFSSNYSIGCFFNHTNYSQWEALFSNNVGTTNCAALTFRGWDETSGNFDITKKTIGINAVGTSPSGVFLNLGDHLSKWIYVVLTRSGTSINIYAYQDGVLSSTSGTIGFTHNSNSSQYYIGRHWAGDTQIYNGNISMVQVYNRVLTPSEVLQNYNATKGRFGL